VWFPRYGRSALSHLPIQLESQAFLPSPFGDNGSGFEESNEEDFGKGYWRNGAGG